MKNTQESAQTTTGKAAKGFRDEEPAAMRERAQELETSARRGPGARDADRETQGTRLPTIRADATLYTVDQWCFLRLPEKASKKLPSRGQVAVRGTLNGHEIQTVLELDGYSGHLMRLDEELQQTARVSAGDTATLELYPIKDWPEPKVPRDLETALAGAPEKIQDLWQDITPMARWEWVRWVNATRSADTRKRRVEVTISKMNNGKRRPCCFDLSSCTDADLSRNGRLVESSP